MALEVAFEGLCAQYRQLRDSLQELRLTVAEDRPPDGAVALVDACEDTVEELLGWLEEARPAAAEAAHAARYPLDLQRAIRSLTIAQERFNRMSEKWMEFASYEHITALTNFGQERLGAWLQWVESCKLGIHRTSLPIHRTRDALFACWREVTERVGVTSVSVQATNIGQQISVPNDSGEVSAS